MTAPNGTPRRRRSATPSLMLMFAMLLIALGFVDAAVAALPMTDGVAADPTTPMTVAVTDGTTILISDGGEPTLILPDDSESAPILASSDSLSIVPVETAAASTDTDPASTPVLVSAPSVDPLSTPLLASATSTDPLEAPLLVPESTPVLAGPATDALDPTISLVTPSTGLPVVPDAPAGVQTFNIPNPTTIASTLGSTLPDFSAPASSSFAPLTPALIPASNPAPISTPAFTSLPSTITPSPSPYALVPASSTSTAVTAGFMGIVGQLTPCVMSCLQKVPGVVQDVMYGTVSNVCVSIRSREGTLV
ncbi:hypothetical protein HK101_003154 [Irineochytrium annulatum]|nr:hypothetical protein HK101_003154 [Irineochytrium annulatum]